MRAFIEKSNLPFLATPMGKGVVKDTDKHSVGSARTFVLKSADVIFLCGARLNWILHFGAPPRFRKDVKFIQLDNDPHEIHNNVKAEIPLVGDAKVILGQLTESIKEPLIRSDGDWWKNLDEQTAKNKVATDKLYKDVSIPMNYYSTIKIVEDAIHQLPNDFILVSEGSNTMDIGRAVLTNDHARQRLDAATFAA
jgi:2-hydroxyacyl-CoA lyase 1